MYSPETLPPKQRSDGMMVGLKQELRSVPREGERLTVLVLDQGRQALPFLKMLRRNGHEVWCACHSRLNEVWFSRYPTRKMIWPSYLREKEAFERTLLDFVRSHRVDVLLNVSEIGRAHV